MEKGKVWLLSLEIMLNNDEEKHECTDDVWKVTSCFSDTVDVVCRNWKLLFETHEGYSIVFQIVEPEYFVF